MLYQLSYTSTGCLRRDLAGPPRWAPASPGYIALGDSPGNVPHTASGEVHSSVVSRLLRGLGARGGLSARSGVGVRLVVRGQQPVGRQVRVDLGRRQVPVSEELLDDSEDSRRRRACGSRTSDGACGLVLRSRPAARMCLSRILRIERSEIRWPKRLRKSGSFARHSAGSASRYWSSAASAWSPIGTIRSLRPLPRARISCWSRSRSERSRPISSDTRRPLE